MSSSSGPLANEREHRRRRLVEAYRLLGRAGLSEGSAGHLTVRDPEHLDRFWVAPYGVHFDDVRLSDLVLTDRSGVVHVGSAAVHPAVPAFHGVVLAHRADVVATVHTHPDHVRALAATGARVRAISQEACAFVNDLAYLDTFGGIVVDPNLGGEIVEALGERKALMLRHHGAFTVGGSVEEALWWTLSLEAVCRVQLLGMAAGPLEEIAEPTRSETASAMASSDAAVFNATPLFATISARHPEMYQ